MKDSVYHAPPIFDDITRPIFISSIHLLGDLKSVDFIYENRASAMVVMAT